MLEYLGAPHQARAIMNAVLGVLKERRVRAYDLGGNSTTKEPGTAIVERI